jgi:hypothetical protein
VKKPTAPQKLWASLSIQREAPPAWSTPYSTRRLLPVPLKPTSRWRAIGRATEQPEGRYAIVRYEDLVADPEAAVRDVYERFGFEIDREFGEVLRQETSRARKYRSRQEYDLKEFGLTREQIADPCRM